MGYISWNGTKKDAVDETIQSINKSEHHSLIKKQNSPSGCWYLVEFTKDGKTQPIMLFDKIEVIKKDYESEVFVKSFDLTSCPYFFDMSKPMFKKWEELCKKYNYIKTKNVMEWEESYTNQLKLKDLSTGDIVYCGDIKLKFKYYYTKSKSQIVAVNSDDETFRYKVNTLRLIEER